MKVAIIGSGSIGHVSGLAQEGFDVIILTSGSIAGPHLHDIALASVMQEGKKILTYKDGLTEDIIKEILSVYASSWKQTKNFAKHLQGATLEETCRNVWEYVKSVTYKLDPVGIQWVKTPARTIHDGFGDCKAYSILANSLLQNLGIDCHFRFASYSAVDVYTHVYSVATDGKKQYIIDACLPSFNEEKPFSFKLDKMTKIYRLSGIGTSGLVSTPFEIDPTMNAGQLSLLLMRERLELEQQIAQGLAGIGTTLDQTYNYDLALINEALRNIQRPELISGIGAAVGKTIVGKFLQKTATAVKTGAQAVAKVVTAPIQLAVKGILEVTLPKSAPAFLYLFLTPEQLAKSPDRVKKKQAKASRKAKFITGTIGMKEDHFMSIIRNGIMKQMGRTPEQVIASQMKAIAGIGIAPALIAAAIPALMDILQKIASLFKKEDGESYGPEDLPNESDWEEFLTKTVKSAATATPKAAPVQVPTLVQSNSSSTPNGTTITVKSLQTEPASQAVTEATEGNTPGSEPKTGFEFKPWMLGAGAVAAYLIFKK